MRSLKLALIIGTTALALTGGPAAAQPPTDPSELMRVVEKRLVSKTRVGRSDFLYEYALTAENNTNTDYSGVFITANSSAANVQIVDGTATLGGFNAFSRKQAGDTIKVQLDRTAAFDPNSLRLVFDDGTVAGIDADANGVRDDLDQHIRDVGETDQRVKDLMREMARQYQRLLTLDLNDDQANAEAQEITLAGGYAKICLGRVVGKAKANELKIALTIQAINSNSRRQQNTEFDNLLSRVPFGVGSAGEIDSFCDRF